MRTATNPYSPRRRDSPWRVGGLSPRQEAHTRGAAALRPYRGRGGAATLMVFEEIIRSRPCRRAAPWRAEGFTPTARSPISYRLSAIGYSSAPRQEANVSQATRRGRIGRVTIRAARARPRRARNPATAA